MISDRHREALKTLVAESGKSAAQILDACAPAWELTAFDRALLAHEFKNAAPTPAERQIAHDAAERADKRHVEAIAKADTRDVTAYREHEQLRAQNPFAAARYRLEHSRSIEHGQLLEEINNPDPPPEAA